MKENVRLGPFQIQILECKVKPLTGESAKVMVMPLKARESQLHRTWPLSPKLHVLHTFTRLKMSSSKVSMVVSNMSKSPVVLKKGVQMAWVKKYLGSLADTEEGHTPFCICNSLVLSKGLLYISTMPKGELEGVLAFLIPSSQCTMALNSFHHDMDHKGQQRMLALTQECHWWQMKVKD